MSRPILLLGCCCLWAVAGCGTNQPVDALSSALAGADSSEGAVTEPGHRDAGSAAAEDEVRGTTTEPTRLTPRTKLVAASDASDIKSPFIRKLLGLVEQAEGGTSEERRLVRRVLMDADEDLRKSLGNNLRQKILDANNRPAEIRIGRQSEVRPPAEEPPARKTPE